MTITIKLPSGERREISQDRILIGRGAHCPICIPDAGNLQDEHARLRKVADRWMIESRGDWLIRVGNDAPSKFGWLKTGDVIRLSRDGPELVFEPAHEDVVLAGLESAAEAAPNRALPPPLPTKVSSTHATPPPLADQAVSRTSRPPPLPSQPARFQAAPPPFPADPATHKTPPLLPGRPSPRRPQPPPLPTKSQTED
jgi:hypothetical protein